MSENTLEEVLKKTRVIHNKIERLEALMEEKLII